MSIATVIRQDDPNRRGRSSYVITGPNAASVQDAINTIMATVDGAFGGANGSANFLGPVSVQIEGGWAWAAKGFVQVEQPEQVSA